MDRVIFTLAVLGFLFGPRDVMADCKDREDDTISNPGLPTSTTGSPIATGSSTDMTSSLHESTEETTNPYVEVPPSHMNNDNEPGASGLRFPSKVEETVIVALAVVGGTVMISAVVGIGISGIVIALRGIYRPAIDDNIEGKAGYREGVIEMLKARKLRVRKKKKLKQKLLPRPTDWEIDYSEIEIGEQIGSGAFGIVYKGMWRGQVVAVKEMKKRKVSEADLRQFRSEAAMMREYCENGSVDSLLKSLKEPLPRNTIVRMAFDVAKGMLHLHKEGIIHRDLAARNLLLDSTYKVKIADFGLSRVNRGEKNVTQTRGGPLKHMAPECVVDRKYSIYSDVWAYGITILEIVSRREPYPQLDGIQVAVGIVNGTLEPQIPEHTPDILVPILSKCFQRDPTNRIDFEQICAILQTYHSLVEPEKPKEDSDDEIELDFFEIFGQPRPSVDISESESEDEIDDLDEFFRGVPPPGPGKIQLELDHAAENTAVAPVSSPIPQPISPPVSGQNLNQPPRMLSSSEWEQLNVEISLQADDEDDTEGEPEISQEQDSCGDDESFQSDSTYYFDL